MIQSGPTTKERIIIGLALVAVVAAFLALIVGLVTIIVWVVREIERANLAPLQSSLVAIAGLFTDVDASNVRSVSIEKLSLLATAIATVLLFWATLQLRTATQRQVAADSPVLRLALHLPEVGAKPNSHSSEERYKPKLHLEDRETFAPGSLAPARYLYLEIINVQNEPFAAARDIEIRVRLRSEDLPDRKLGQSDLMTLPAGAIHALQKTRQRVIRVPVLGAGSGEIHPIFNVAPLESLVAAVEGVVYYDLRGKKARSAAYGGMRLNLSKAGNVSIEGGYSEPARWEMP